MIKNKHILKILLIIINLTFLLPSSFGFNCPFNPKTPLPPINGFVDTNLAQLSSFPLMVENNNKTLNLTLYFTNNETHFYAGVKLFNGSASNDGFDFNVIIDDGTIIDRKYVSYDSLDGPLGTDTLVDAYYDGGLYDYDPDFHIDGLGAINLTYNFSESQYFYQGEILFPLQSGYLGDIHVDSNQEVSIAFMFYFKTTLYFYPPNSHNWTGGFHPILSNFSRLNLTISGDSSIQPPPVNNNWMYILITAFIIISIVAITVYLLKRQRKRINKNLREE